MYYTTVSHSINKCTLFLACLWRQHQRQKHSRHATRHVLFLITDGDRVYPDIKIKSILEETSKLKKLNPAHQGTQPQSYRPPLPSDTTLVPHRLHRPALTERGGPETTNQKKQSTMVTSGVFVQMPISCGQGSLQMFSKLMAPCFIINGPLFQN